MTVVAESRGLERTFGGYLVDLVEEAVGVLDLDLLLDPPVGGDIRDISLAGRARAVGEDSDDATIPCEDDNPGVSSVRYLATRFIAGHTAN